MSNSTITYKGEQIIAKIPCNIIILAAGNSTRMGSPKGLIKIEGKTIINHHIDLYNRTISGETVVVLGKDLQLYKKSITNSKTQTVSNPFPEKGQFCSLKLGLRQLKENPNPIFITTIDKLPPLESTLLKMYTALSSNDFSAVIPSFEKKNGHPVLLGHLFCLELQELDENSPKARLDLQIKDLPENKKMYIGVDDSTIHGNFNTISDLP